VMGPVRKSQLWEESRLTCERRSFHRGDLEHNHLDDHPCTCTLSP
jgi:hypothetical protein